MTEFKREDRYLVIKRSDIPYLSKNDQQRLAQIAMRVETERLRQGRRLNKYVAVADDWPEYETVFKMIEARVTGVASNQSSGNSGELSNDAADARRYRAIRDNMARVKLEMLNPSITAVIVPDAWMWQDSTQEGDDEAIDEAIKQGGDV